MLKRKVQENESPMQENQENNNREFIFNEKNISTGDNLLFSHFQLTLLQISLTVFCYHVEPLC
jgi:hypothetical protein